MSFFLILLVFLFTVLLQELNYLRNAHNFDFQALNSNFQPHHRPPQTIRTFSHILILFSTKFTFRVIHIIINFI